MLDSLTLSDFAAHLGVAFPTHSAEGEPVGLILIEATAVGNGATGGRREPFSLIFLGPEQPALEQRIYALEHPSSGRLEIFLVPLGPARDRSGMRYQAIFT